MHLITAKMTSVFYIYIYKRLYIYIYIYKFIQESYDVEMITVHTQDLALNHYNFDASSHNYNTMGSGVRGTPSRSL